MTDRYPSEYEEVFTLILSLVEQVKSDISKGTHVSSDDLENYFERLSKGTLGEYEFTRRMAFEGFPVVKIAAFPILWRDYAQPVPADFIVRIGGKTACVEVKNYTWKTYLKNLVIKKSSVDNCLKFKQHLNLDAACVGIKRFGSWYLLDITDFYKFATLTGNGKWLAVPVDIIKNKNLLNEEHVIFDVGNEQIQPMKPPPDSRREGIYYKGIKYYPFQPKITFKYGTREKNEENVHEGLQAEILGTLYLMIEERFKDLFSSGYEYNDVVAPIDLIPTKFAITDRLRDKNLKHEVDSTFNTLKRSAIMIGKEIDTIYYLKRIAGIIFHKYDQLLKERGFDFKAGAKAVRFVEEDFKRMFR